MNSVLTIRGLNLKIRQNGRQSTVLRNINLDIRRGQVHGLVGESGAGKSLLGKAILGILPSSSSIRKGSIHFGSDELTALDRNQRRLLASRHIAMIPQDPMTSLNPVRRIGRQMCDVLHLHRGLRRKEAREQALQLLNNVQIRDPLRVIRQYPFELSGGMRQRVLIAMAFSCRPGLIIADEPTTALDVTVQRQILRLIKQLQTESGTALLFITHDLGVVAKICDFVSVITEGRIVEQQAVEKLFKEPQHSYTRTLLATIAEYYQYDSRMSDAARSLPLETA